MIRVEKAPEPEAFGERVRRPGLDAIRELVGEPPSIDRPGPKRKKIADRREDIPPEAFPPFWRDVLDEMLTSYHRLCSYLSLYIEHATGSPSVDHVIAKSKAWNLVYEWTNYRLASALINSKKSNLDLVLDPFEVEGSWFALELVGYQVKPGVTVTGSVERAVIETIDKLGLNTRDCCLARQEYVESYNNEEIQLAHLERRAPFIARELRRQGKLRAGDR